MYKILRNKVKIQSPYIHIHSTSHHHLVDTAGVPKSTFTHVIQQQDKLQKKQALCRGQQGASHRQECEGKDGGIEETLHQ
jgi:hypothetical protein